MTEEQKEKLAQGITDTVMRMVSQRSVPHFTERQLKAKIREEIEKVEEGTKPIVDEETGTSPFAY